MFKIVFENSDIGKFVNNVYDIATLQDVALGYLIDEEESKRIAEIAGRMKFNEAFESDDWIMLCVKE